MGDKRGIRRGSSEDLNNHQDVKSEGKMSNSDCGDKFHLSFPDDSIGEAGRLS